MPAAESLNIILLLTAAIYVAVCAGVGLAVGTTAKRPMLGFWLGFLLGLVGLLIMGWAVAQGMFDEASPAQKPQEPTWWDDKK